MFSLPRLAEIEAAAALIDAHVPPSPVYCWPLLNARAGAELWVKHDNHTAIGSFKLRGALAYVARLRERDPAAGGVVAASRGNFGQAVAYAANKYGLGAAVVVPRGNSPEKNRAIRGLGAELIESGDDFQAALEHSAALAAGRGWHPVPSFHRDLVLGNAGSALAFLRAAPSLDAVCVPIGLGSGICALLAARAALGVRTEVIGVVADRAPAMALSFAAQALVRHPAATRIADGLACSTPDPEAFALIRQGAAGIVRVGEDEIEAAMRAYFADTHNVAEGAAAAALAAVLQQRDRVAGRRIGVVCTGGNVDAAVFARVLGAG
jgi:threonine dehydratase